MDPARLLATAKFLVREATAFVGHSFSEEDKQVVNRITGFLGKLGVACTSGERPEPKSISEKVKERLLAAELFVGIFTRRDKMSDGKYTTSPWVIEEKATAVNAGKRLLLFVEEGVERQIGGLQGDFEYLPFNRTDLADALIRSMDYVLAITAVPLQCQIDLVKNTGTVSLRPSVVSPEAEVAQLKKQKALHPADVNTRIALAWALEKNQQRGQGISELQDLVREQPNVAEAHHALAHLLENDGNLDAALFSYQNALDRDTANYKYHRCYGRSLYQQAKGVTNPTARRKTLEKAKRLLERAAVIGGEPCRKQITEDLFLVNEALFDHAPAQNEAPQATRTRNDSARRRSGRSKSKGSKGSGKKGRKR